MSVLAAIARRLIRSLSEKEREDIILEFPRTAEEPATDTTIAPDRNEQSGGAPDWDYVWRALLDASSKAGSIKTLLSSKRAYFDFEEITDSADQLQTMLCSAYELMCKAPRFSGLTFDVGENLDMVRERIDVRRAEIVDAELTAMHHPPAHDAPVWSIDYRPHGGFLATSHFGGDTGPWKFWGAAPTAHSAASIMSWYFLNEPSTTVFDPPLAEVPRPLATLGPGSDISPEGPDVGNLLDRRGRCYEQHIAACRSARETVNTYGDVSHYLTDRATELNATDPQLRDHGILNTLRSPRNRDHDGFAQTVQWVPTSLVVATNCPTWGDFGGHRERTPYQIVEGLLSDDLDKFTYTLFTPPIALERVPGWAGPLYRLGGNGNHRIHTARMLNLPWAAATVGIESIATSWDMLGLITNDLDRDDNRRRPLDDRLNERAKLLEGLIRRGIIDGELIADGSQLTLFCRSLPAAWLLRAPREATAINTVYESRYPGALAQLGIPEGVGTDPVSWTRWLDTP